jgi:hypothetical protein
MVRAFQNLLSLRDGPKFAFVKDFARVVQNVSTSFEKLAKSTVDFFVRGFSKLSITAKPQARKGIATVSQTSALGSSGD